MSDRYQVVSVNVETGSRGEEGPCFDDFGRAELEAAYRNADRWDTDSGWEWVVEDVL